VRDKRGRRGAERDRGDARDKVLLLRNTKGRRQGMEREGRGAMASRPLGQVGPGPTFNPPGGAM